MVIFVYASGIDSIQTILSDSTEYSLIWIPLGMLAITAITFNRKYTSYDTWYLVTWLQFSQWLGLINTSTDDNFNYLYQKILKGLNGDQIITVNENTSDLPSRFTTIGITSYYFINNTEKYLFIIAGCISIYILLIIFGFCYISLKEFRGKIWINLITRAFLICYFNFFIFGMLQIENLSLSAEYGVINTVFAVIFIALSLIILVYLPIYANNQVHEYPHEVHYSTILQEFTYKEPYHGLYYFIFLLKRVIAGCALVFIQSYPLAQVIIIGLCIILEMSYLLKYKPYIAKHLTYFSFGAEICQLIIVICISLYLLNPSSTMESFLWFICFLGFWVGIFICIVRFFITLLKKSNELMIADQLISNKDNNNGSIDKSEANIVKESKGSQEDEIEDTRNEQAKIFNVKRNTIVEDVNEKIPEKKIKNILSQEKEEIIADKRGSARGHEVSNSDVPLELSEQRESQSGIPYYSKLVAKYTRGLNKTVK